MKVKSIKSVGHKPVYDLSINSEEYNEQQYILKNGVVSHNTGIYYSADNIWILGRRQNKTGTEVTGYDFVINVDKSRYVKEKSQIPISVSWEGGIEKYSGLLDLALAFGFIQQSGAWYQLMNFETGEIEEKKVRASAIDHQYFDQLLQNKDFQEKVKKQYTIGYKAELSEDFLEENDSLEV